MAAGGEQPLMKNHAGDTLSARWSKAGMSWCMNNGDIPDIPTAEEESWGRRLRAAPANHNFVCREADIGTNAKGQHSLLADEALRAWLTSPQAGIAYWYCYVTPFIDKYSTAACYDIIKNMSPLTKTATEWPRKWMARSTAANSIREYVGVGTDAPPPEETAVPPRSGTVHLQPVPNLVQA